MKVSLNEVISSPVGGSVSEASSKKSGPATPRATSPSVTETQSGNGATLSSISAPGSDALDANVIFRRDPAGQIYYVVTDAQSGKELQEIPQAAVRKAGEGIAEYLKQEESKSGSRIKTEA